MTIEIKTYPSNIQVFLFDDEGIYTQRSIAISTDGTEIESIEQQDEFAEMDIEYTKEKFNIKSFDNEDDIKDEISCYYQRFRN